MNKIFDKAVTYSDTIVRDEILSEAMGIPIIAFNTVTYTKTSKAMEDYAEVKAVAFAEWVMKQDVSHIANDLWDDWDKSSFAPVVTTERLYEIFLTSIIKNKPFNG